MHIVLISTPIGFLGSGKGGGVELTLNSLVTALVANGHTVDVVDLYKEKFTRVPYSGAFVGGSNIIRINDLTEAQTRSFKGDLIPPETFPKIVFEAKHYANFQWNALALGKSVAQLDEWIQQSEESCEA